MRYPACSLALLLTAVALQPSNLKRLPLTRRRGFFDVLSDAFANDEEYAPAAAAQPQREASVDGLWKVELTVVGVPTKDPNSDLYGPKQRATQEGRGIGGQAVEATLRLQNGAVEIVDSSAPLFVEAPGAYRYSDGELRIKLEANGFTRTFTTKGTLQSIYGGDDTTRTSSVYAIPPGPMVLAGALDVLPSGAPFVRKGKLLCQTTAGLFGAATKSSPAGSFIASAERPSSRRSDDLTDK